MKLTTLNLDQIPKAISRPLYDRNQLKPAIVHIGLGNFHRAHQAWYLHRLMQKGEAHDWAIIGAGVRPYDEEMRKKLAAQDYLSTLIELDPDGQSVEIIGSMIDYVPVEKNNATLIAQMADPAIRIVSTTVTEGGYYIDPASAGFNNTHPDIIHDANHPDEPCTAFGAMIAALKIRRNLGLPAFTCQSCDNLIRNGEIMRQTIVSLAQMSDPDLADWIDENSSFPNSMVDCIVPATGSKELALAKNLGISDQVPVTHENFRQWVTEDHFCAGRPDWENVGVTITDHVHDYEKMKIRMLNGGHQIIAAAGDLLKLETISATMSHALISAFFDKVEQEEIMPHVSPVSEFTPNAYLGLVKQRFCNPEIIDTVRRVAFDGSSRQPGFILPSVYDCLDKGIVPNGLALVSAIWARYCLGLREDGSIIEPNDPHWDIIHSCAQKSKYNPENWLEQSMIYGDLENHEAFAGNFKKWLAKIYDQGIEAALEHYLRR